MSILKTICTLAVCLLGIGAWLILLTIYWWAFLENDMVVLVALNNFGEFKFEFWFVNILFIIIVFLSILIFIFK